MPKTSDRLLLTLKMLGRATAATIAGRLALSPQAARKHLDRLAADGLIAWRDEGGAVGRPKRHWSLTPAGEARFPDTHAALTVDLIDAVRDELGAAALDRVIARREASTRALYEQRLAGLPALAERVAALAEIRDAEGYMAEWRADGEGFLLVENHCPICAAARVCQGFCRSELAVFGAALGADCTVERTEHLLAGARRCAYRITPRG